MPSPDNGPAGGARMPLAHTVDYVEVEIRASRLTVIHGDDGVADNDLVTVTDAEQGTPRFRKRIEILAKDLTSRRLTYKDRVRRPAVTDAERRLVAAGRTSGAAWRSRRRRRRSQPPRRPLAAHAASL